jgi:hypothetical protein
MPEMDGAIFLWDVHIFLRRSKDKNEKLLF